MRLALVRDFQMPCLMILNGLERGCPMSGLRLWFPKWSVLLDRLVVEREKAGIWEFHRSASTYYDGKSWLRHVAIIPAEPKHGAQVQVFACNARGERDSWIDLGTAKAVVVQD